MPTYSKPKATYKQREPSEIIAADNSFRNDSEFTTLKKRWNTDFDLYRLKQYDAGTGYYSYTTNASRILAVRCLSMITSSKLSIRVPLDSLNEAERIKANNLERLMYGMLNLNDTRFARLSLPSTIEQMAWHALIRGGFGVRPYLYKDAKGETAVNLAIWDLYTMSYDIGAEGTNYACYTTTRSRTAVEEEYGIKIDSNEAEVAVTDYWDQQNFGIIVKGEWAAKPVPHGLDYCPVYVFLSGAQPPVSHDAYTTPNIHRGESVYSMNRDMLPMMNKVLSDYATIIRRGVKTPLGYWSAGATKNLEQDIYQVEKAGSIPLDSLTNEKIAPLLEPTMPTDASKFVEIMTGEEQRGGLTHVALGELGFRLSGFAINQLVSSIQTIIDPFVVIVEKGLACGLTSLHTQYTTGSWAPLRVRGRDSKNKAFGYPTEVTIDPADIEAKWRPEVKLLPLLPKDDAQRAQLAHMARADGTMSLDTIQDAVIGLDDPALEQEKMAREWANNQPINRLYNAYIAFVADGQMMKAQNILAELKRIQGQVPTQPGVTPTAGLPSPTQAPGNPDDFSQLGQPGAGVPVESGMSPDVLPSEMLGGTPPGAQNAIGA